MSDIIRVIRIYEFVGPRDAVELQVRQSIQGEKRVQNKPLVIRAATLGTFPEILDAEEASNYNLQAYACGYASFGDLGTTEYDMFAGPFWDLESALQTHPEGGPETGRRAVLLRFEPDGRSLPVFWYSYDVSAWLPERQED